MKNALLFSLIALAVSLLSALSYADEAESHGTTMGDAIYNCTNVIQGQTDASQCTSNGVSWDCVCTY